MRIDWKGSHCTKKLSSMMVVDYLSAINNLISDMKILFFLCPGGSEACSDHTRWPESHRLIWPQPFLCSYHVRGLPGVRPRPCPSILSWAPIKFQRGFQSDPGRFGRRRVRICSLPDSVWPGGSGNGASFLHGLCVLRPDEADGELSGTVGGLLSGVR